MNVRDLKKLSVLFIFGSIIVIMMILIVVEIYVLTNHVNINRQLMITNDVLGAIIVEPRKHRALKFVAINMILNLPKFCQQNIIICHSDENFDFCKAKLKKFDHCIKYVNCGSNNFTVPDYNRYICSMNFWRNITWEKVLMFQTDSMILSNRDTELSDFIKYDYIGAPWKYNPKSPVGNGGFSLRTTAACIDAILTVEKNVDLKNSEDVFFSNYMKKNTNKWIVAPANIAKKFSVESIYYPKPFGVHKCWCTLSKTEWKKMVANNKELEILRYLQ